jgi:predicted dehydrogenase
MPYRCVLAGVGAMGSAWLDVLLSHESVEVVGLVDPDLGRARSAAERNGLSVWIGDDLPRCLAEIESDFVLDATPPDVHEAVTVAALGAGRHVLGEKPLSISIESAQRMVKAAEESGRLYMVSQSRRYDSNLGGFCERVRRLGRTGILTADFFIGPHFGGFRDEMDHPLLLDMAIHTFDMARKILRADAVAVTAHAFRTPWSWYGGSCSATAHFEMSNGSVFDYRGSWSAQGCPTSWQAEWRAIGEHGTAKWNGETPAYAETVAGSEGFLWETSRVDAEPIGGTLGIAGSLAEFIVALDSGGTPQGECHDNIRSLAMVFAAIRSAESGRRIELG